MTASRGYTSGRADNRDGVEVTQKIGKLKWRAEKGEVIDPADFPTDYCASLTNPNRNLVLPLWHCGCIHIRDDMVAVLRRFDLGNTILLPIRVALADDAGIRTDFSTISVANLKSTIDPARSEPLKRGRPRRSSLFSPKPIHAGVVALPAALDGPDIWTDPQVSGTIFVSDRLAQALRAEEFSSKLGLKKVRVVAEDA